MCLVASRRGMNALPSMPPFHALPSTPWHTPAAPNPSLQTPQHATLLRPCNHICMQTVAGGQLQAEVVRAMAAAAGRYMHVIWPESVHEPGLLLSEVLLATPGLGAGWAGKVRGCLRPHAIASAPSPLRPLRAACAGGLSSAAATSARVLQCSLKQRA